jgi:hypothetical protein
MFFHSLSNCTADLLYVFPQSKQLQSCAFSARLIN